MSHESLTEFCERVCPTGSCVAQTKVLQRLHDVFSTWLTSVGQAPVFHMFVTGSFRLNVFGANTDLDVVLVTHGGVSRKAVFGDFVRYLQSQEAVTDVSALPLARVPIISACMDGQDLDIMTVHLKEGPEDMPATSDLHRTYDYMNGVDEASILSFNGTRVTETLVNQYCDKDQREAKGLHKGAFRDAVRFLRFWARQRAIYSNKAGFLGGVNIALLVAWAVDNGATGTAHDVVRHLLRLLVRTNFKTNAITFPKYTGSDCPAWLLKFDHEPASASAVTDAVAATVAAAVVVPVEGEHSGGATAATRAPQRRRGSHAQRRERIGKCVKHRF